LPREAETPRKFEMRISSAASVGVLASAGLLSSGCGHHPAERAATGALGGAVVAGPVGAVAGAVAGAAMPRPVDEVVKEEMKD
jgi:osmotically inducible lipoprotein OsmB